MSASLFRGRLLIVMVLAAALCPMTSLAAPAPLRVTEARLDGDPLESGNGGRIMLKSVVDTTSSGVDVAGALLANNVVVTVRDAGLFNAIVPLSNCLREGRGIRCKSGNVRAKLKPTGTPSIYGFHLTVRDLGSNAAGATQPRGPVRASIQLQGSADLVDVISDCKPVGRSRLGCRDQDRPNIVFIVTDDQRWDTLQYMPRTLDRLASQGVRFTNAFATTPVCGPSRASLLTGRYARNHGVLMNVGPSGGAPALVGADASTIATWLHDAGYRTGMYGKYMVGYGAQCPPYQAACYRPPGWDEWHVFWTQHYYNYTLNENGVNVTYGGTDADYSTDVITAKSVQFVQSAEGQPFFLHVGYHAPHGDSSGFPVPATRHKYTFTGLPPWLPRPLPPWQPPSWDEADISDKPPWFANLHRAADVLVDSFTYGSFAEGVRLLQLEAGLAVDEGIEAIVSALEATGQADNTVIVLTSDNGYFWGEHRFWGGKDYPYEESVRVPLLIRYPRMITSARSEPALVLNIDIPPTLARLAGVEPPATVDGKNVTPLLRQETTTIRDDFRLEWWNLAEVPRLPTYVGVRTADWKYVTYPSTGETELYDLVGDPYELDNRVHDTDYQDEVATLQARLDALLAAD